MTDISSIDESGLEDILSEPTEATRKVAATLSGDIAVLGAGGKMGPTLAMMLKKASGEKNIYAVSRFSEKGVKARIEEAGVKTIEADLLDEPQYCTLPKVENVFYLAGMKFGTTGNQPLTWALNSFLPGLIARHYKDARIVVFSTGNVYPLVDINSGGAKEQTIPEPIGEYAQSCLGRERMFEYFSQLYKTPVTIVRLNYANEPRYGIIVDLTLKILNDEPIDLTMGAVNLIWQRDANDYIIHAMSLTKSPPAILNVTGSDTVPIRQLAKQIGKELGQEPKFVSQEAQTALLSNASYCFSEYGYPTTTLEEMISVIVKWVTSGKKVLNKPTKYDIRDGKF
ncbi:MAG: NAD-dependent epimerase/dehydratase family protein [Phycisphaerae bacterium]|nr:NAD(P)-dependent oxidoreductase [Phycisphaerae bacterium]NIP52344.1 NAD(P)-dependent oxidoreductase [Phycisphaerae bacterium]NIS51335.1 NAD(P)-dependent oxidoreductase [Phycisphaerae bacterium]NIU08947.1 NAD(P)-dependent oxidoreductase [Phycisphaerae bacterium]NIU56616.1 NAD-dependent epimerase/dehydratase family protein [Phycisphaerae bacterium]